jgi:transketolase
LLSELSPTKFPDEFVCDINRTGHLCVVEEHGSHGGAGQIIAHLLLKEGKQPERFTTKTALGYPSGKYGSQKYHRAESGLDPISICKHLEI